MKKVFIVHGFGGTPNGGWRPWLMAELEKQDVYACALPMPTPENPVKEEWVKTITNAVDKPIEEIFLVGHSLGVPAILRYLESLSVGVKIGGAVLVSGPCAILNIEDKESKLREIDNFLTPEFNYEKIKSVCNKFVVVHGRDDEIVPLEHAEIISQNLDCELIIIENGGHLNGRSGWDKLPQARDALLEMMK